MLYWIQAVKGPLFVVILQKKKNLRKNSKIVNFSSIKDSGELINVDEVKLYIIDEENTSSFQINKALAIKRESLMSW